ncbi:MAG TPA: hypothetical protein DCS67_05825 [Clostridiales bacterium UBA8960]|jgi:hypothetical protein|nr:hypothetical protein [Clostridiales bacterium UBA8960]
MKHLNQSAFDASSRYILNNARYLEKLIFGHHYIGPCPEKIVKAIKMYQNKDGGFGNALEPDFRMPYSSPMATSVALRLLSQFKSTDGAEESIVKAIHYLEHTFDAKIMGWESVGKAVNLFPHAPWWKYHEPQDKMHGNPSAELVGYLIEFSGHVKHLDVESIKEVYIQYFLDLKAFEEHEVFAFIRLYNKLSDIERVSLVPQLKQAYTLLVSLDSSKWDDYVPYPLKFIMLTEDDIFEIDDVVLKKNVNFLIDKIHENGCVLPTWSWGAYHEDWEIAKREWSGILTLDALLVFERFHTLIV